MSEVFRYKFDGYKFWFTAGLSTEATSSSPAAYLACLLDAERVREMTGCESISHGRPVKYYEALLRGDATAAALIPTSRRSRVILDGVVAPEDGLLENLQATAVFKSCCFPKAPCNPGPEMSPGGLSRPCGPRGGQGPRAHLAISDGAEGAEGPEGLAEGSGTESPRSSRGAEDPGLAENDLGGEGQ
eukprot:9484118-Pyramimonas_sp.AAC.2